MDVCAQRCCQWMDALAFDERMKWMCRRIRAVVGWMCRRWLKVDGCVGAQALSRSYMLPAQLCTIPSLAWCPTKWVHDLDKSWKDWTRRGAPRLRTWAKQLPGGFGCAPRRMRRVCKKGQSVPGRFSCAAAPRLGALLR
eukprot:365549-Chlamydomonas_euryale.AAC.3